MLNANPPLKNSNKFPGSSLLQPGSGGNNDFSNYQNQIQNSNGLQPNYQQFSLGSNTSPITKPDTIKVILNCLGQRELVKDVPLKFSGDKVLLNPILNYIKYIGKPISGQSISYFSEEDEMDVYVGIEGANISDEKSIAMEDITCNGKLKLTLNVKVP